VSGAPPALPAQAGCEGPAKAVEIGPGWLVFFIKPGYDSYVLRVRISELKNQLSRYLRAVRRGEEVEVLDRDVPIARILPISSSGPSGDADRAFFEEQARMGVIRRGTGKIPARILKEPPPGKPGVLAALLAERREGR
jgi:prevent-host-death family protein